MLVHNAISDQTINPHDLAQEAMSAYVAKKKQEKEEKRKHTKVTTRAYDKFRRAVVSVMPDIDAETLDEMYSNGNFGSKYWFEGGTCWYEDEYYTEAMEGWVASIINVLEQVRGILSRKDLFAKAGIGVYDDWKQERRLSDIYPRKLTCSDSKRVLDVLIDAGIVEKIPVQTMGKTHIIMYRAK